MMNKIVINYYLEDKYIRISLKNGVITGALSLLVGNEYFPSQFWDDFTTRTLDGWIQNAINLYTKKKKEIFFFMDGPYSFEIEKIRNNACSIRCCRDNQIIIESEISYVNFIEELIKTSTDIINYINEKKWNYNYKSEFIKKMNLLKDINKRLDNTSI